VLAKFGSILNVVEGLNHKSPRDIKLLGNPLKGVRSECVVRDIVAYDYGNRCSDVPFVFLFPLL
jgi:hypothetical protein